MAEGNEPVVITLRGEARAVLQDVTRYEETQETSALLKVLALTNAQVEAGKVSPAAGAFQRIRERVKR